MSDGFVYFIQEEETDNIKIGFSEKHPKGRLKEFQTGNSNKLILLGYIEGTPQDESNLHQEFYEERIRNENEWFKPSHRMKERIKELLEESLEDKKSGIEDLNLEYNEEGTIPGYGKGSFNKLLKKIKLTWNWMEEWEREWSRGISDGDMDIPSGHGVKLLHENESKYVGEMSNGEPNGQGTETVWDGTSYLGEYKDGKKNGQGTETYKDKELGVYGKFKGEWKDGKVWNGTYYDKRGDIFEKVVNGKRIKQ